MIAVYKTLFWSITEMVTKAERFRRALDCTTLSSLKTNILSDFSGVIVNMRYIFFVSFWQISNDFKSMKISGKRSDKMKRPSYTNITLSFI